MFSPFTFYAIVGTIEFKSTVVLFYFSLSKSIFSFFLPFLHSFGIIKSFQVFCILSFNNFYQFLIVLKDLEQMG